MRNSFLDPTERSEQQYNSNSEWSEDKKSGKVKMLLKNLFYLIALALIVAGTAYAIKTKPEILGLSKPADTESQKEAEEIIAKVGKIIQLPADEQPTIATVNELEKVREQQFFKNALIGDKVLVYQTAKKAFLYRPSENKIIEVGVVNISNEGQVAGDSSDIQVISPTPLPTNPPVVTSSPTPTLTPTRSQATISPRISTPPPVE
jgi:hypothetical protein